MKISGKNTEIIQKLLNIPSKDFTACEDDNNLTLENAEKTLKIKIGDGLIAVEGLYGKAELWSGKIENKEGTIEIDAGSYYQEMTYSSPITVKGAGINLWALLTNYLEKSLE